MISTCVGLGYSLDKIKGELNIAGDNFTSWGQRCKLISDHGI